MTATQAEAAQSRRMAVQSQQLAEEMKEDSIAMKTVCSPHLRIKSSCSSLTPHRPDRDPHPPLPPRDILRSALSYPNSQFSNSRLFHQISVFLFLDTLLILWCTYTQAILAMPFFTDNEWIKNVDKFWVWVLMTVPATGLAFMFYLFWRRRELMRKRRKDEQVELSS